MTLEEQTSILGRNIKRRRCQQLMSQIELAERLGVHRTYIGKVEGGLRVPSINILLQLAELLYIRDWRDLLFGDNETRTGGDNARGGGGMASQEVTPFSA